MTEVRQEGLKKLILKHRYAIDTGQLADASDSMSLAKIEGLLLAEPAHTNIEWPTEAGLWLRGDGDTCWAVDNGHCDNAHDREICVVSRMGFVRPRDGITFTGPLTVIIPEVREPSPWDYEPQEGDWVWVRDAGGEIYEKPQHVRAVDATHVDCGARFHRECNAFAKAEVSTPPAVEESV